MRLRPSGDSGPLVASMAGYENYLRNDAWTWEHQALVRSRSVFSDAQLLKQFNNARESVFSTSARPAKRWQKMSLICVKRCVII